MTKATLRKPSITSYKATTKRNDPLRNPSDPGLLPIDVNTIDYDIQQDVVDIGQWGDGVKNISRTISLPESLSQRLYKTNRTEINNPRKERVKGDSAIRQNSFKNKLTGKASELNNSHSISSDNLSFEIPYKSPERTLYPSLNFIQNPTLSKNLSVYNKSKSSNTILDDLISKYAVIKKRSINQEGFRRGYVLKDSSLVSNLGPLKRSDRGNHDSFSFFSRGSNEEDIDPVSSIFDKEFLFGGTQTGHEGTTPFPIVDKDYDYNAEYDYVKDNSPSDEEPTSEESYEEDKEETNNEYNDESGSTHTKPKENSKVVINVVKQEENQESNENEEEEEDEDVDIIREPPIIVLYKGGDSKQLQPGFEYALTHGGLDPRYLTKDPLAGPLATRGFNHNFQVMRGVPIQGNVVQPSRRYPTVGGFNTTQIHAILQPGQLPTTTMSGNNKTTIGVVPIAPTDYVGYGRPVTMGQYFTHPYPGNSPYMTRRPISYVVRPNYYGGRGRRPHSMIGPIRSPSALVVTNSPRYVPSYRGGHMLRYRGNRNHMARYRPINVGTPRGTRMAILTRRESTQEVRNPLL